jgi:hypothetical protein
VYLTINHSSQNNHKKITHFVQNVASYAINSALRMTLHVIKFRLFQGLRTLKSQCFHGGEYKWCVVILKGNTGFYTLWSFRFSQRQTRLLSGILRRAVWEKINSISEELTASIVKAMWRLSAPLNGRSFSTRLQGATSQKTIIFTFILTYESYQTSLSVDRVEIYWPLLSRR